MPRRELCIFFVITICALAVTTDPAWADSPERTPTVKASPAQDAEAPENSAIAELKKKIPQLMEAARIPGLQIALIRDGSVTWTGAFGVTRAQGGRPVTSETIFEAASLTKPLFAYVVMQMVDRKLLDLDTPLLGMIPTKKVEERLGHPLDTEGFRLDWAKKITARHVLSHSAGMPHGDGGEIYPIFFEPGTDWKYSAEGYQFLQLVVEGIEGRPLEEIVDTYVLEPLGMAHSSMVWRADYTEVMANGHWLYEKPADFRKRSGATAAASLYTTAGDYARFVVAVLDGVGLKAETSKEMLASFIDMNDDGTLGWGLGFGTQVDGERSAIWQWGDYGIFRNYVIADRSRHSGVVYLTNSFNGLAVCSEIVTRSVGQEALGCLELGYLQYDSPAYAFLWDLKDKGPAAASRLASLTEKYPDVFTDERIEGLAGIMENEEMYPEATAIYRFVANTNPRSGGALFNLARVSVLAGDLAGAKKLCEASLSAPEDPAEEAGVTWALDYIRAIEEPAQLDSGYLQAIAGDYGPRHLTVRENALFYSREDAGTAEPRRLKALSKDFFFIEGVTYFKLQVVFDEHGSPTKLVGIYESGQRDESPRNP